MTQFKFPLWRDGSVHPDAVFLAHSNLIYGELKPIEQQGIRFAIKGEVFNFVEKSYPEILKFPSRVQLLIDAGHIEFVKLPEPEPEPVSALPIENEE